IEIAIDWLRSVLVTNILRTALSREQKGLYLPMISPLAVGELLNRYLQRPNRREAAGKGCKTGACVVIFGATSLDVALAIGEAARNLCGATATSINRGAG